MSLRKLNYIVMSGVLPFNFGMDYDDWVNFYSYPEYRDAVANFTDPATWTPETINEVNRQAKEEKELADRLMALPDDEFHAEVDRLAKENFNKRLEALENNDRQTASE